MYKENEQVILLQNVGIEGDENFIPKGSELIFLKAVDDPRNISRSMVVVQFEDRQLALPELAVKPKHTDTINELKKFNSSIMEHDNHLRVYHHNPIMRFIYRVLNWIKEKFPNKEESKKKKIKDQDIINEIKALMQEGQE